MGTDKKELGKEVAATYQVTNKPLIPGTTRSEQRQSSSCLRHQRLQSRLQALVECYCWQLLNFYLLYHLEPLHYCQQPSYFQSQPDLGWQKIFQQLQICMRHPIFKYKHRCYHSQETNKNKPIKMTSPILKGKIMYLRERLRRQILINSCLVSIRMSTNLPSAVELNPLWPGKSEGRLARLNGQQWIL